jgi:ABC-type Zn2+ transport system substrate-binding protein/surface adhesin
MSFGSTAEKLLGHGHGHDHDHDHDHGHGLRLHPTGDGFVAPKAKHHGWLDPDPAPWRGIRDQRWPLDETC